MDERRRRSGKSRYQHPSEEQVAVALATAPWYQPWLFEGHCREVRIITLVTTEHRIVVSAISYVIF